MLTTHIAAVCDKKYKIRRYSIKVEQLLKHRTSFENKA